MVPNTVATTLLPEATARLLRAARSTASEANNLEYQLSVSPCNGNESDVFALIEKRNRIASGRYSSAIMLKYTAASSDGLRRTCWWVPASCCVVAVSRASEG